jgi:hypothetical protein
MAGLRKFIGTKHKQETIYVPPIKHEDESKYENTDDGTRAHALYLLYKAMQRKHGKWVVPYRKDKRMRTCFRKLAKKLEELEAMGVEVDEVAFLMAHKATYGKDLRPTHLISWCSVDIYQSYLTQQNAQVVELTDDEQVAYDDEILTRLGQLRGESKEDVAQLLTSCGLL